MREHASDLARRLGQKAEAVCRHYLSKGRRHGRYWLVGDIDNTKGRSLYVRLTGPESGKGAAGKWTDAATGEHGDLLDLIAANQRLSDLPQVLDEARRFLSLPDREPATREPPPAVPIGSPEAARRLYAMSKPIQGTLAASYLRARDILDLNGTSALRFHPRCFYRPEENEASTRDAWPALIAAVTDLDGIVTGAHRTWLDPAGADKAPVATPRRAMGQLLGHGVRFGVVTDVLVAGEGVETMLSLRRVLTALPAVAALSAAHLAALQLQPALRRLYIARERDDAGRWAADRLATRAREAGIEPLLLDAQLGDFNDDLRQLGAEALWAHLRMQLAPEDVERFMASEGRGGGSWPRSGSSRSHRRTRRHGRAAPSAFREGRSDRSRAGPATAAADFLPRRYAAPRETRKPAFAVLRCASAAGERPAVQTHPAPALRRPGRPR